MTQKFPNKFIPSDSVSTRTFRSDGAVLFDADAGREEYLNETGLFLWQMISDHATVEDAIQELSHRYGTQTDKKQIQTDVMEWCQIMETKGFIKSSKTLPGPSHTAFPDDRDAPRSVDISVTGKCNLRCSYCFYHDEMDLRNDLPLSQWQTFFQELKHLSVRDVTLSGGEFFIRKDYPELIDAIVDSRMQYSILTNGTLIQDKDIKALSVPARRKRLQSIQVSIDGSCADIHDKTRGKGSFEKAIHGLRLLTENHLPATARITINRYNVDDLHNIATLLLDKIGLKSFSTNQAIPIGSGSENKNSITFLPGQELLAMKIMKSLKQKYGDRITGTAGPLDKIKRFGDIKKSASRHNISSPLMGKLTACGCIYNKLSINHDGTITPCNLMGSLTIGRVSDNNISSIWQFNRTLKKMRDRRYIQMTNIPECKHCPWVQYCNGGCPALPYSETKNFFAPNRVDCYKRFILENGIDATDGLF